MNIDTTLTAGQALTDSGYRPTAANAGQQAANAAQIPGAAARSPTTRTNYDAASANPGFPPGVEQIQQAIDEVRTTIAPVAQNLLFSIDEDTGHTVVRVVDAETDEVIRQIPSEEILAIAKALDKLQGVLLKQEA